ncbi:hypothetical protein LNQ03_12055 [Klebsiella pneumoniae subsp. pneumoniae]|nr:hypothetical protein [Klebsiella pneumoniae subsp. pneumoniae]
MISPRAYEIPSRQKAAGAWSRVSRPSSIRWATGCACCLWRQVLVIMLMTPGMAISVWLIPVWIAVLGVGYLFKEKAAATIKAQ